MIPIKIQCACGQRYAFDIEPVNGQMPMEIACPGCGVDGTAAANAIIAQSGAVPAAPPPTAPGLRTKPPPPPPARSAASAPAAAPPLPPSRASIGSSFTPLEKLTWYQQLWIGLPFALVAIGGMIGGALGGAAYGVNQQVFKKTRNPVLRYVFTGLISLTAVAAYFGIVVLIFGLRKKN